MMKNIIAFAGKTIVTAIISVAAFLGFIGTPVSELHNIADYKLVSTSEIQAANEAGYKAGYEDGFEAGSESASGSSYSQSAVTNVPLTTMYVADGPLNLRESPSTSSYSITQLDENQAVSVDKIDNGWAHVTVNGMRGWCAADYLSYAQITSNNQSERTVWVSRTGHCYHRDPDCSNMDDPIPMSESDALEDGRDECSKCF